MTIIEELKRDSTSKETILTIGVFDGVHLGHRHLMSELTKQANTTKRRAGVITFQNHPASVINPEFKPNFITSVKDRVDLLLDTGVDFVSPISFDREVSSLSAEQFTGILVEVLNMSGLVVGPDFRMGKNRDADVSKLAKIGINQWNNKNPTTYLFAVPPYEIYFLRVTSALYRKCWEDISPQREKLYMA